jgi:hypothetical protein
MLGLYAAVTAQDFAPDRASALRNGSGASALNVRAICALDSMRLIKLGETPDYFHHSILAMNHGLKLSDEKYEAG